MTDPITETRRSPVVFECAGRSWTTEHTVIRFDDWRETTFGPVNFGMVWWGPRRWVELKP